LKPLVVWSVQAGDGKRVADIVARMRGLGAPDDGRVYLNGRPASAGDRVEPGDRVEIYPQRAASADGVQILAQRDGVVLVYKPAGMPTESTRLGEDSLVSAVIAQLKGGRVHAASRLDTMVSGVCLCTLGKDAARRVLRWRQDGQLQRSYLGIGHGTLADAGGRWEWPLATGRDRGGRHRALIGAQGARPAATRFAVKAATASAVRLRLDPETGRMHQLRAHAARAGVPLYGDRLYGGPTQVVDATGAVHALSRLALHAAVVETPTLRAEAPLPADLETLWRLLGG
jgi:23S rRNA-/tRNA-specific pseudouridylate synthase